MSAALDDGTPDLIICDYTLPAFSAPDALALVKARGLDVPFFVISGSIGEDKAVAMMRAGAHDYLLKENLARLGPAVERELRDAAERSRRRAETVRLAEAAALYEATATHQAQHDALTDLPNRSLLRTRLDEALRVEPQGSQPLALLLLDLDRFKEINDTLGHHYGDQLLIELAHRLGSVLRPSESVARLGGDEFGILITHLSDATNDLEQTLEKIRDALDHPFQVDGLPLHVEASIGVARYPEHGRDVDLLLQRADVAMYVAKDSGMPHAIYTAELDHHDTASLTLLAELPRALRNRELVLHYQPKLDVHTGKLAGIEALTRWQHPTRGLIPPGDFVPAAEKTGLIQPLTRYVLDEALTRWKSEGQNITVAVNLSMRNLHDPTLPEQVAELLRKWDLSGECLTLEITESAIVSDPSGTKDIIRQLRELGVGISIDDFGTGYTSLAYLARLPITQLKIDRSFVVNMDKDAADAAIVRSIITLGHDLDLEVVAEGVETLVIYDQLARLGCDTIQGYWLSRSLPPAELIAARPEHMPAPAHALQAAELAALDEAADDLHVGAVPVVHPDQEDAVPLLRGAHDVMRRHR